MLVSNRQDFFLFPDESKLLSVTPFTMQAGQDYFKSIPLLKDEVFPYLQ